MTLTWEESGGPPVQQPTRTGFGSKMIEALVAKDLGAKVDMTFASTGLRCRIQARIPARPVP